MMASPITIGAPTNRGYAMSSNVGLGFADLDILSSSYKQGPGDFSVRGSLDNPGGSNLHESIDTPIPVADNLLPAAGSVGAIGRDEDPNPDSTALRNPVSELSGLMVMLGSGLFGAGVLLRRKLGA